MKHKKRRNLRSRTTRQVGLDITLFIFIVAIMLSLLSFNLALTGFFSVGHPAGGIEWENRVQVTASSDQQNVTYHIVFGNNRPEICADGVRVETLDGQQVVFKTANEAYGEQGLCTETDVVFGNVIYQPPQAEQPPSGNFSITGALAAEEQTITYNIYYGKIETQAQPQAPVENLTMPATGTTNETNVSLPVEVPPVPEETRLFGVQGDAWWNSSFACRKIINVTNSGGTALTNYTVVTNISYLTGMQADFDDVRFVYNGTSQSAMYHQKLYVTNSVAGQFAFLMPSIAANNNETVYMYYCNSSVADGSNASATWNIYDPFDGASYNATRWETHYLGNGAGPESFTVSGGILDIYVSGQSPDEGSNTWQFVINHTTYSKFDNLTICANISMVYSAFSKSYGILGAYQYESFTNRSYLYSGAWDANQFSNFIDGNNTAYSLLYTSTSAADFFPNNTWGTVCLLTNNKRGVVWINTTKKVDNSTVPYFPPNFLGGFAATASYRAATGITSDIHVKVDWVGFGRYSNNISVSAPFNTDLPTHTNPILNSTSGNNLATDNITCYNQTTYSPIGRSVTNIYNWYKNGTSLMLLNMPFDSDGSGGINTTKDYSGNGNNGQLGASTNLDAAEPTWTSAGKVGGAYSFDGTSDYITTNDMSYFNGVNNKLTVAFWIKDTNLSAGQVIVGKYNGATSPLHRTFLVQMHTNGILRGVAYQDGDAQNYVFFDTNSVFLTQNVWAHVAVVFDLSAQNIDIYVNGTEMASTKTTNLVPPTTWSDTTIPVEIGRATNPSSYLNGTLDEVRMYGSALSAAQIYQLYQDTKDGYSSSETITSNEISGGNTWMCQVTPSDGTQDGTTLNSSNLTITSVVNISSCQTLSTANTIYNLNQSITGKDGANSWCLRASANNIIIDCHGYNVSANASGVSQLYGIYTAASNITVRNCNVRDYSTAQIAFVSALGTNNTIQNNTAYQFNASLQISSYGIYLAGTTANTTIINNTVRNTSTADLFLSASGAGNVVKDTILDGAYLTKINLTWGPSATAAINVKAATSPAPADPATFTDIGKYVAVTNSSSAWAFLNISYTDTDAVTVSKSSLRMSKNNGSWYTDPTQFASSSGNDSTNDYVWANITNFGSTFAPMGTSNGNVSSCQILSIANTIYNLTSNLTGNLSTGRCIDIKANNVTLDCAGYSINGTYAGTTYGVYVGSYNNTAVKNCIATNYTNGIYLTSNKNNNLTNNTANNNTGYGIYLTLSSNNILTNNIANNNTNYGIWLNTSNTNNTLTNNTANSNNFGIYLASNSNNNTLTNNTANYNSNGFWLASGFNNTLSNNIVSNNTNYGIYQEVCSGNNLTNNTANYNTLYGIIFVSNTNKSILVNNTASYNVGWDFYSQSSAFNNTITNLTTNDTNSSFTYNGSIYLKSATGAGLTDPVRYSNISHYLNITNGTAGAWLFINISYTDSDVPALLTNTSTIQIWKYSSGQWWNSTYVGTPDSIDTTNKYVYANITNFSSIYAPMGSTTGGNVSGCRVLGGGGTYNLTANLSGISDSSCLNITVGDMVLDCKGYSISANASGQDYGIYAGSSTNVTIKNCNIIDYGTAQIYFDTVAGPNTIQNCTIGNSTQSILRGIWLAGGGTTSTTITNNTIYGATQYDLRLGLGGGNIIVNTVIGNVNPTNINLTYKGSVGVKAASFPAPPTDFRLLGRAVDVTNLSSGSSAVLNVSYLTSDIPTDVLEANLKMAKNNGSWYTDPTTFASSNGVDTGNHYVWANITTFGSQFGPLGISQNVSACRTINVAGTYNLTGNLSGAGQLCGGTSCCINIAVGGVVFDCKGFSIVASAPVQNLGVYSNSASTTIQNCDIADYAQAQIYFTSVNSGTIQNDTVRNSSRAIQRGIWLTNTGLTTITGSTAYNAAQYDIQLDQYPVVQPNTVRNTVIGKTYPTNISFDYGPAGAQIGILGVTAPTPDTAGLRNIHSYVDIVNTSAFAGTWGLLNISYTDAQAWGTDDYSPTFNLYKSSGGGPWQDPAYWAKPSSWGSDPVNNYVWANMTNFSSLVGGFGDAGGTLTVCPTPNYPINMSGYWHLNQSLGSGLYSPCILVTASNVTLDGVGYTVSANSIFGAYADNGIDVWNQTANLTNVTVENLYVSGFDLSEIRLFNVANSSVINNTIDAFFNNSIGGTEGIGLESNAYNITVANNSLIGNAILLVGVTSYGTSTNVHDNLIKNNTIYSTGGYRDTPPIPDLSPIQIWGSSNNTITNNNLTNYYHYGVSIFPTSYDKAENNLITNNTFKAACNINNYTGPVCFGMSIHSNNTNITNNVINSSGTGITVIMPVSNYMFITNNTLYNNPLDFDIYSGASFSGPSNITATNNTLGKTYPTNISFTLGGTSNIGVLIATNCTAQNASCYMTFTQPADPFGFRNVSKYVEVFTSGDTWLALNVSYSDSDLGYLNESRLVMAKHNATTWNANTSSFANNFGVDTVKNVVYANITDGSIGYPFAPLVPSCTNISQSNTNYELTTDLVGNATSGICIQVLATNITLDCAGYNLNGTYAGTTIGVYDNGYNNATIKNCNIRNYSEGIDLSSANNSNFINNTVNSNTDNGIQADHISSDTFVNNTANSNTQYGIYVLFGNNDTFTNNTFNSNGGGIRLESSGSSATNTLTNNTVNSNTQNGIYLRISPNTTLTNNNASLNSGWDFSSDDVSTNNKITNLTTNDTNSSFTYSGDILLKSATGTGKTDPTDYTNISHYLNITNNTNAWIFLNVSYKASDIPSSVSDNLTLKIWKYSSGQWWNSTYVGTPDTVDTTNKYVYANITNFSSIFAPMGSTAGVGNCMSLTAANSIYNLTTNLFGVQSGQSYCIDVTANNITLDCKGYSINGTTSGTTQGIWIGDYGNITIKNCNVRNYTSGLRIDDTDYGNSLIINNTFNNNTREGILANLGSNELIANNTAYGNTRYGIALESSFSNNTLLNNTFNSNGYHGFWIQDNPVILTNNTANSNGQRGFSEQGSYGGNIYTNNTANSNTYDGFFLYNTHNISLTNSTACNNPGYGIYVYNSYNNNITVSNASFNTWDFVSESSSTNNKITNLTTNDTTSSFTYVGEIYLKSASGNGLTDPTTRYTNISHYLNITGPTWAYINISYKDADVPAAIWNTSAIQIWKYSSGQWRNATYVGTPDSIDTTNKYVYANITNFSSIYAPLGGTNHLPNAPTLLNPPDNVYPPLTDRKPYLNWTIPTDADGDTLHFQIQLANDSGFSQLVINQSSVTDTTGFSPVPPVAQGVGIESYKVQNNLAVDKQYFWRARAYDGYDWGSWSATFSFNVTKKIECVLGQSLTSFGSTVIPGTAVNGTLNYADANNGTMYNISNTGNVNENITQWGTNMTCLSGGCSGDYIDVGNMSWKSNVTASNGTNMIYANKIKMTATEDLANPIATNLAPTSAAWYRQWLATRSNQGGGSYNGTYTQQCIAS